MAGSYEEFTLKVNKWDVIKNGTFNYDTAEELIAAKAPDITYIEGFDYETHGGSQLIETIEKNNKYGKVIYKIYHYYARWVLMDNLDHILVDERTLWKVSKGNVLNRHCAESIETHQIKSIDPITGETLFEKSIDYPGGVVHDVEAYEKEHFEDKDETVVITDKEQLLNLIKNETAMVYELASDELKKDPDVVKAAFESNDRYIFNLLSDEFINDVGHIMEAIKREEQLPVERFSEEVLREALSDREFVGTAFKFHPYIFTYQQGYSCVGCFNKEEIDKYASEEMKQLIIKLIQRREER